MKPSALSVEDRERLLNAPLAFPHIEGSPLGELAGHQSVTAHHVVGTGQARLDDAAEIVFAWQMHRRAGLTVRASTERITSGTVAILRLGIGPSGHEEFMLELQDDDNVDFTISTVWRPASLLARLSNHGQERVLEDHARSQRTATGVSRAIDRTARTEWPISTVSWSKVA